ncbi:MAG: protein-glutamate O-methyltransferase family protein [Anaerolineae bacterium]|nr:protein-glutamate O-methyltransferase family protein [Anaerolineae bacterium]
MADHRYPHRIIQALQELHDELAKGQPVHPLETTALDGDSWHEAWRPHQDKTWFEIPWYFAEVFFYRRLLEAAEYFGNGDWAGVDPFLPRKQAELTHDMPRQVLLLALVYASTNTPDNFCTLFRHCIWGNRIDLSHPHLVEEMRRQATPQENLGDLLVDDTEIVLAHLQQAASTSTRIDFLCDNTGTELLLDLSLVDFFLRNDWTRQVTLHVKFHPTYVSDTTVPDMNLTLDLMQKRPEADLQALANRLRAYRRQKRLLVKDHLFWNSSQFFWEFPPDIQAELSRASLVIIKGDANYRRLLGDAHWPPDVPFAEAIPYFPAPFVALRTMKSNVVTGLQPGQAAVLNAADPEWRANGRRGVIQAVI